MSLEINNHTYNLRAISSFQNLLLSIRAWFYEKEIIKSIFDLMGRKKSNGVNIDLGGGTGHKTKKIYENLIGENGDLILIEPANGMIVVARDKLRDVNIIIQKGDSSDLSSYKEVDNIFCNQMTHHLDREGKRELFKNTYNSLVNGGRIIILDTTIPKGKIHLYIFNKLVKWYGKYVGKGNKYYNITTQEYINLLQQAGFEVDIEYTRHFYILGKIGEILTKLGFLYPFMTQIVAKKPIL